MVTLADSDNSCRNIILMKLANSNDVMSPATARAKKKKTDKKSCE